MDINQCKIFFDDLLNKYQVGGYVSPEQFDLYAGQAQYELYVERMGNPNTLAQGTGTPREGLALSSTISDDLKVFLTRANINMSDVPNTPYMEGLFPSDYYYYDSSRVLLGNSLNPVKVIDEDKFNGRVISKIVPPTNEFPIGLIIGNKIQIAPKNVYVVNMSYYRKPVAPVWNYTLNGSGYPVYNSTGSVDFELPDNTHNEIIMKMLKYMGITLREGEIYQMSQAQDNQGV